MRLSVPLLVLAALLARLGQAQAQPVVLELSACPVPAPDEVRALVSLELKERLVSGQALSPADAQHVQLSCSDIQAEVVLRDTGARRSLSLVSVPEALRARLLALAIAELTSQHRGLKEPPREPPVAPEQPKALAPHEQPAPRPRYLLAGGAELSATPLLGAGGVLAFVWRVGSWLALDSSLNAGQARTPIEGGTLRVRSVSLRTGPALVVQRSGWLLQLGLGVRAGIRFLAGEPDDPRTAQAADFHGWFVAPAVSGGLGYLLGRHGLLAFSLELDYTLPRVRAEVGGGGVKSLSAWRSTALLSAGVVW